MRAGKIKLVFILWSAFGVLFLFSDLFAQRIFIIAPTATAQSNIIAGKLTESFSSKKYKVLDNGLGKSVLETLKYENPFNMTTEEAQNFGNAVGGDFIVLLKAENLRRTSFSNPEYYESYAAIYLVSSRTGKLAFWTLKSFQAGNPAAADEKLFAALADLGNEIEANAAKAGQSERANQNVSQIEELPAENSPEAKNFRPPLPYRRLRPVYTPLAGFYNVTATVDVLVDLNEAGNVIQIEITRWAGYGLDESVEKTIREMQWRAASRDGKLLPIRVLLRYNFKKIEEN